MLELLVEMSLKNIDSVSRLYFLVSLEQDIKYEYCCCYYVEGTCIELLSTDHRYRQQIKMGDTKS